MLEYNGKELSLFENAKFWRKYIHKKTKNYFKNNILEIGAGIGSFTLNYFKDFSNITLTEPDPFNLNFLKKRFQKNENIKIINKFTSDINENFDTIIFLNVLEHIKDDEKEINECLQRINENGHLVILVPANNNLYSKFDEEVGHYRRYDVSFFKNLKLKEGKMVELKHLDVLGYFLYYLHKLFFKQKKYPTALEIFIWDKIFTPCTMLFDFLTFYKFGKNILCVIKKIK